jgi:hypothetical protein
VSRTLQRLQLNRREFIDPNGDTNREPQRIVALRPGHMAHIDVKKVGKIPDGGGWRAHGRGSPRPELQLARRLEEPGPATSTFTRQSTGTRASPTPRHSLTRKPSPRLRSLTGRATGSRPTASPTSSGSSPTTGPATAPKRSQLLSMGHDTNGSRPLVVDCRDSIETQEDSGPNRPQEDVSDSVRA